MKSAIPAHAYFPVADAAIAMGFYLTGAGREVAAPNAAYPQPTHPDMYMFSWNSGRVECMRAHDNILRLFRLLRRIGVEKI